jgi:hypothetical protein
MSRISVLQCYARSGVCHSGFEFNYQYALNFSCVEILTAYNIAVRIRLLTVAFLDL